jgi:hypothetical protein
MDKHVAGLAGSRQPPILVEGRIIQEGGAPLSRLWQRPGTLNTIREGESTVVVLQEIALKGSEYNGQYDKETFFEHVRLFNETVQDSGGETILFMYWANPSMDIEEIAADHFEIAEELGLKVAPVGLAWDRSLARRPELLLHHTDNVHANVHGNYLAAAVLYATIFEESPEELPYVPDDIYGDVVISAEDLAYLQGIAWATVREYLEFE